MPAINTETPLMIAIAHWGRNPIAADAKHDITGDVREIARPSSPFACQGKASLECHR